MWAAMILYDEGRLGYVGCYGLKSKDDAIAWLNRPREWEVYKRPSCWIRQQNP